MDWPEARALWDLDPDVAYLNHGTFGPCPRPVLDEQARLRRALEAEPVDFLLRTYDDRLAAARTSVAGFLGGEPEGLAFVPNATTGVATVLHSLGLAAGDRVVLTDHAYAAVRLAIEAHGCDLVTVALDLDDPDPAATILAAVDERTRLVVVDAITSPTAYVLPVASVVRGCRAAGVPCLVDAAHAPGQVPVDLRAIDPDYWTGNLHKWGYAPKGAAVLYVRAALRDGVRPLVVSHFTGFPAALDWTGTQDPTPWLAAPAALALLGDLGWAEVRAYGSRLAWYGAGLLDGATVPLAALPDRHAQMVLVDVGLASLAEAEALRDRLRRDARVEVGATGWRDRGYLRLSGAPYNRATDYERLAAALAGAGVAGLPA